MFSFTDDPISTGAIVGIAVGAVIVIVLIIIIILTIFVIKAKRRRDHIPVMYKESAADHSSTDQGPRFVEAIIHYLAKQLVLLDVNA